MLMDYPNIQKGYHKTINGCEKCIFYTIKKLKKIKYFEEHQPQGMWKYSKPYDKNEKILKIEYIICYRFKDYCYYFYNKVK